MSWRVALCALAAMAGGCNLLVDPVQLEFGCKGETTRVGEDGTCYFLANEGARDTYAAGEAQCLAEGARLAVIESAQENALVATFCPAETTCQELWIGLDDRETEGVFVWTDGTPLGYTSWQADQPNNQGGAQNCVAIEGAEWEDSRCGDLKAAICERPIPTS